MGVRHGLTGSVLRRGHRARTARRDTAAIRPSAHRSARRAAPLLPCAARRAPRAAARSTAVAGACVDRHRERTASARRTPLPASASNKGGAPACRSRSTADPRLP
ncbi:hypothetical protein D2V84_02400 [Burkholderia pseudomallei]|nr:hypothetical protein BOC38_27340 [Burkholderia pseudomallei]ARM02859.1 hypothetical protein BOC59_22985 [Burkholderia pseudomallei]RIV75212.1 hypothetical protein D2W72_05675 [Burkholderia pseudomallei]RIV87257.1 hypothetical protein D2V84_02400 [Burkholderia pseudomallei]